MKKSIFNNNKIKDIFCILVLIIFYLFILVTITDNGKYILGSKIDFSIQHYNIPEYFRMLFYKNHDLFPDFALNLGAGENIYYLSYYGLLSPITFISYLFPHIKMLDFSIISMIIIVILSIILFYFYLKKSHYSRPICFILTFIFLCSGPLIFHSHRHIMFINYFPFLILGLYGVDKFFEHKSFLLITSLSLMILTSYYYSIPTIVVLFIFAIYKYIKNYGYQKKDFLKFIFSFSLRIIISILISGVLILPTFYTLLNGRASSKNIIPLVDILRPNMYMLYSSYSMGLNIICLVFTILMVFSKRLENKILSFILLSVSIFPVFNYILNGFLYINSKVLIPFIVLVLINMGDFMMIYLKNKKNIFKYIIIFIIGLSSITICLINNLSERFIFKSDIDQKFYKNYDKYIEKTNFKSDNLYRTNTSYMGKHYIDKVGNLNEYKTTIYSSVFNHEYNDAYTFLFSNPLPYRNKMMLSASNNLSFQMYMGEKYIYTSHNYSTIYKKIYSDSSVKVYKNDYVLPLGYASSRIINKKDFKKLTYPDNIINMLGGIITDEKTNTDYILTKPFDLDYDVIEKTKLKHEKTDVGYDISALKGAKVKLKLKGDISNKLLFIDFDLLNNVSCIDSKDQFIQINEIKNKLTCKEWKYNNQNTHFSYNLLDIKNNTLTIRLEEGKYKIGNIRVQTLDLDKFLNINKSIDHFIFDKKKTTGDKIVGNINVRDASYFTLSIPYDKGFKILVDNKPTKYLRVNEAFIGFPISKGKHHIEITYSAPYKKVGMIFSITGIVLFVFMIWYEKNNKY